MKKIRFLFITLIALICINSFTPVVFAREEEKNQVNDTEKEEVLNLIYDYLDEINKKIVTLDKKIENAKKQKEFDYYPAIRLNVDTPMFGLSSIVENKLRVRRDISTSDVAGKYTIRNIINTKKIRLPDSYIGAIVMSTKEVEINSSMELSQAKLTLVKCIQYLSQVNGIDEFVDTQINNIFRDYISNDKKSNINDVKNRIKKVSKQLVEISDNIKKLEFLGIDISEYKEIYLQYTKDLIEIRKASKNTLILDNDLNNLIKLSLTNESNVIDLDTKISQKYEEVIEDIDYGVLLENMQLLYSKKTENMRNYIESSTTETKKIENEKEVEVTKTNYLVTSNATLDYMKFELEEINKSILEYKKQVEKEKEEKELNQEQETDEKENEDKVEKKTKEQLEQERQTKIADNMQKVDSLYNKYKEMLSREYKFYTSNINMLLKDSNDKVSTVISQIDSGIEVNNEIFEYTKYIYIELPEKLNTYIDENNVDSVLDLENLVNLLRKVLLQLSDNNINITKLYDDILKITSNS